MTATVKQSNRLTVPASIQRLAGLADGDLVEFKAVKGRITIIAKQPLANSDKPLTGKQRSAIDRELAKGLQDLQEGRIAGPFSEEQAVSFLKNKLVPRSAKSSKPNK